MIRRFLDALAEARCPVGYEDDFMALLQRLAGGGGSARKDPKGPLVVGGKGGGWLVALPIDEPTLLFSGEGEEGAFFGAYGLPTDPNLLRHRAVWLQDGRTGVIDGPENPPDLRALWVQTPGPRPPAGSYATWPGGLRFQAGTVIGRGAAARSLAAIGLTLLRASEGRLPVAFLPRTSFSRRSPEAFFRTGPWEGVVWLSAVEAPDRVGRGALRLRGPGLPGDADLDARWGLAAPVAFVEADVLPPSVGSARQAGMREFGVGLARRYPGEASEIVSEEDAQEVAGAILRTLGEEER